MVERTASDRLLSTLTSSLLSFFVSDVTGDGGSRDDVTSETKNDNNEDVNVDNSRSLAVRSTMPQLVSSF